MCEVLTRNGTIGGIAARKRSLLACAPEQAAEAAAEAAAGAAAAGLEGDGTPGELMEICAGLDEGAAVALLATHGNDLCEAVQAYIDST